MEHPTLLRRPELDFQGNVLLIAEDHLPYPPQAYHVEHLDKLWVVRVIATGEVIYRGPGPVEVLRSPAPF